MNELKPCIISYLPPPNVGFPESYIHNLQAYKHKFPLILFSDHDWGLGEIRIGNPEVAKTAKNRWAVNNALFLTALKILSKTDFTHFIFMEADSRVGVDDWDLVMWKEYLKLKEPRPPLAGSMVVFNPCGIGLLGAQRFERLIKENKRKAVPIPCYGGTGSAERNETTVLVNGSIAIYSLELMKRLFPWDSGQVKQALQMTAFDYVIGQRLREEYGLAAYDQFYNLVCTYSSYGNIMTTEEQRKKFLINGTFVAVHQIDSNWKGPRE